MKIIKNPDTEYVAEMKNKLKENSGYCPCSIIRSQDTKCMCKDFRDQVARNEPGFCHCGLYCAVEETEE